MDRTVVVLENVSCAGARGRQALRGVDLALRAGELLAVAGVEGNGQVELAEVLAGVRELSGGSLRWPHGAPGRDGIAFIPEDRGRQGLCPSLTVEENLALGRHRRSGLRRGPWVDREGRRAEAERLIAAFDVRPPDPGLTAEALSGGNQQKAVVARELLGGAEQPRLAVAIHPTRGLDLVAAARVREALLAARAGGAAVLVVSRDLDEVRALGDRIAVMREGRVAALLPAGAGEAEIGRAMLAGRDG